MPIEINELTVRARVRDEENRDAGLSADNPAPETGDNQGNSSDADSRRAAEIAQEVIKRQKER